jgi:hypothetical protein
MLEAQVQAFTGRSGDEEGVSVSPNEVIADLKQQVQQLKTEVSGQAGLGVWGG